MLRYIVAALCGMSLTGSVYMAGWKHNSKEAAMGETCCDDGSAITPVVTKVEADKIPDGVTDVKNTKCMVMGDEIGSSTKFVVYQGKAYHICCGDCVKDFEKEPAKYIKALADNPAKYGQAK